MCLDEILNDENYNFYNQNELDHEQALISQKTTKNLYSVERNFVNSKEYHDKFERLDVSKIL